MIDTNLNQLTTLEAENENLKKALRTVFERQKKSATDLESLKIENEKLNATIRKQVTTIPELQIQNRVLQQQLKTLIRDLHVAEKKQEDAFDKLKQFKQNLISTSRRLLFARVILFLSFAAMTGLIWLSYRDNEANKGTLLTLKKVSDENEILVQQNKAYFEERESFQANINKQYKEQLDQLNLKLKTAQIEKLAYHEKLTQSIENFKQQTLDLQQEHISKINLTKNNYENKIKDLVEEKKTLINQLVESEFKNREIVIVNPSIKEPKHNNFVKSIQSEAKENNIKSKDSSINNPAAEESKNDLPLEESFNEAESNKITPFKLKASPF